MRCWCWNEIPLGDVHGRIDHSTRDSATAVDLAAGKVLRRITGLNVAQGVADVVFPDSVYAANAGDGSVRILDGDDCTDHRSDASSLAMMP